MRTFLWSEPGRSRLQIAGRLGWGLADQALSSLTNFGLTLVVARHVGTGALGAFSLVFATYLILLGVSRSLCSDPLIIRYSATDERSWRSGTAMATGAALALGALSGLALMLLGWVAARGSSGGGILLALGATMPGLLLQDCWRYAFIASGRNHLAFVNDLVWAIVLFGVLALEIWSGRISVVWFMLAWGVAGNSAALVGVVQAGIVPTPLDAWRWARQHGDLSLRYLGEFAATGGVAQLTRYGVSLVASIVAVGALRAGELLIGPFYIMFMGGNSVVIAEGSRVAKRTPSRLPLLSLAYSAVLAGAAAAWGAVILLLSPETGSRLLGAAWPVGRSLALQFILISLGMSVMAGPMTGLRTLAAARGSLRARLVTAPLLLSGGLLGAALAGADGAAWGMAVANWLSCGVWWSQYAAALAHRRTAGFVGR